MNIGKQNDKLPENRKERGRLLNRVIIVKGQCINKIWLFFFYLMHLGKNVMMYQLC
jgi:hypothetical protein